MMMKTFGLTGLAALMAMVVACGDSETNSSTDGGGGSGNSTTTGGQGGTGGGDGGGGPTCEAPEPPHKGDMAHVDGITASYIDQDGAVAANVQTTVCGTNICSTPEDSDSAGMVMVDASMITTMNDPRFNSGHNGYEYAKLSGLIPTTPTTAFGTVRVIRMPDFAQGVALDAGAAATQGGVTLDVAAGAEVAHSLVDYPEPSQRVLRGAVVDITGWAASEKPQVDATLGIEVLVVAMPLGTHICPGAAMSFENVNGWAAGAEVDIYINGAKTFEHYAPYGQWAKISEGVVSSDGSSVDTKPGMEIEVLGTFGVAPK